MKRLSLFMGLAFVLVAANVSRPGSSIVATEAEPLVPLASVTESIWFGGGPIEETPEGIVLAYGIYVKDPKQGPGVSPVAVVFDDVVVQPNDSDQTFFVFTDNDPEARALAEAITSQKTEEDYEISLASGFAGRSPARTQYTQFMKIPEGTIIEGFRLTVPAFSLESTNDDGIPWSRVVPLGNDIASIAAIGQPPAGDADCSAVVTAVDALLILQLSAALISSVPCAKVADVSGDTVVDARDAAIVLQATGGLFVLV